MLPETMFQDVATEDYTTTNVFTGSSRKQEEEIEGEREFIEALYPNLIFRSRFVTSASFMIALSSLCPSHSELLNTSFPIEEFYERIIPHETSEDEIVVRMPPVKKYSIKVKVRSVSKGIPRIVDPETF